MKFYISFGQNHTHEYNGYFLDRDCILEIEAESREVVYKKAMKIFNAKFCSVYDEVPDMSLYPRGIISTQL